MSLPSSSPSVAPPELARALDFLYQRINYERRPADSESFRLRRMVGLLEALGNPQHNLRCVHVAGTKGKGSTSQMIAALLQAAGWRTGLYTSPHLRSIEERWRIDQTPMSTPQLLKRVEEIRPVVAELDRDPATAPTFFELTTALAFVHFAAEQVDWSVIEVGLGGRLDSTNVITPNVSVITSIGLDHQAILGDRVELIAAEKAGIIKPHTPVVSGVVTPGAQEVIRQFARQSQAPIYELNREFKVRYRPPTSKWCTVFDYQDLLKQWHLDLELGAVGDHQAHNAALALTATSLIQDQTQTPISWQAKRKALQNVSCPARLEWFDGKPPIILDVAHNIDSIEALVRTLRSHLPATPLTFIFACSADKDAEAMLKCLSLHAHHLILTKFLSNPRQRAPEELATLDCLQQRSFTCVPTPSEALAHAKQITANEGAVVICGSFFLAAEMLPFLEK